MNPPQIRIQNRRAYYTYEILETLEAGLVLAGSEVKSLRQGAASIQEAFAGEKDRELYLFNANIATYGQAASFNHEPQQDRKLLVHRKERNRWLGAVTRKGLTIVPLALYFDEKGKAKVSLGLGRGKKSFDKREIIKQRDWDRQRARLLRPR